MTVSSDWGDWLPREIAAADPEGVAAWYLGCNGLALKAADGTTVFVDPYLGIGHPPRTVRMIPVPFEPGDLERADALFATHEHSDHVDGPSQAPILARTDAPMYAPAASLAVARKAEWTDRWAVDAGQFREVEAGDAVSVGSFDVHVEPACDPEAVQPVSYVFEHDAGTVFHGGDTRLGDELGGIGDRHDIDLGVLAFGSAGVILDKETREPTRTEWYADETEVIDAANTLEIDRLLPSHWDMWKGLTADPAALHPHARSFDYPERLEVVEIGDRLDI